jgi:hypothetical protein
MARKAKRKKQKRSIGLVVFLIVAIILISVFSTVWIYYSFVIVKVQSIPMDFKVVPRTVGINGDRDALHFGKTLPGGYSTRKILITNNEEFPVKVDIINEGNVSYWLNLSNNGFILQTGQNETVYYTIDVPYQVQNATGEWIVPYGNYSGVSTIYIKRKFI